MDHRHIMPLIFFGLAAIFTSCGSGGKRDNPTDSTEISPDTIRRDTITNPIRPTSALFLMDISKSMKGYFGTGDSRLLGVVNSFLNVSETNPVIHWFGTEEMKSGVSKNDFVNLTQQSISWADESDIRAMLQSMVTQSGKYNVCFLLTDGILSGSDDQIRNSPNRNYNIEKREWMSGEIGNTFQNADSITALVVMYESKFTGNYSCYNNSGKYLKDKSRPYYIIAIGKWNYVKYVEQQLNSESSALNKPYKNYALFGDEETYKHIKFSYRSGIKNDTNGCLVIKSDIKRDGGDVILTSDISTLPDYIKTNDYFRSNLKLFVQENNKPEKELAISAENIVVDTSPEGGKICLLTIPSRKLAGRALNIRLRYKLPLWVKTFSDDDDSDIGSNLNEMNKTFNLEYLMNGFAGLQKTENIMNQTIKFK